MASSSISDSYEKLVFVVALVIAVALGAMSFMKAGKLDDAFKQPTASPRKAPPLPGKDSIDGATAGLAGTIEFKPATISGGREIDVFVGIPWFVQQDGSTVDLGNPSEANVHEGIPNAWWLKYGISPGYADSPEQDADNDGFANREEYDAETDPMDPADHPALVTKLRVAKVIDNRFLLDFASTTDKEFKIKMRTRVNGRLVESKSAYIPAGDPEKSIFFLKDGYPGQFRFRLKAVERRQIPLGNVGVKMESFAIIEDLKPNLKAAGRVYEVPYTGSGIEFSDYKVMFFLDAIGKAEEEFEILENTTFALPNDDAATDKPFLFKGIAESGDVIIEWKEDGETKTRNLAVPSS